MENCAATLCLYIQDIASCCADMSLDFLLVHKCTFLLQMFCYTHGLSRSGHNKWLYIYMTGNGADTINLRAGCKVDRAHKKQAGTRQKRGRSESDQPESAPHAAAHATKHKKVRFTEPANNDGRAPHTLSSAQQPQPPQQRSRVRSTRSRADATRRQPPRKKPAASALDQQCVPVAKDSNAGEGFQTAQPSIAARTRSASKAHTIAPQKELTASVPDELNQCCESDKQRHSIAARTRAAGTSTKWTCNNSQKSKRQSRANAAVTRSASTAAAAATTGRTKRKQPATAGPDEEEQYPDAKRVRPGKASAEVPTTGSTAPCSGTATRQTKQRQDKPAKSNQRPARAASVLAKTA